jgi:hypothetical protein
MQDQPSRSEVELLRDVWAHLDGFVPRQGYEETEIGINIGHPKDNLEHLGNFAHLLCEASVDAATSNATMRILETRRGYILVTANQMWAKRLVGLLISHDILVQESDIHWVNEAVLPHRKEIAVPGFLMN